MGFFDKRGEEDNKESKFNEGQLQMIRIHELQRVIHFASLNPLEFHNEENLYGYQIVFNSTTRLFVEASSKCKASEIAQINELRKEIAKLLREKPAHKQYNNQITHTPSIKVDYDNWYVIEEKLFDYQIKVRELLEKHGLTSPLVDEREGLI